MVVSCFFPFTQITPKDAEFQDVCLNCAVMACNCYLFKNVALSNRTDLSRKHINGTSALCNPPVDCKVVEAIKDWLMQKLSTEPPRVALSDNFSQTEEIDCTGKKSAHDYKQTQTDLPKPITFSKAEQTPKDLLIINKAVLRSKYSQTEKSLILSEKCDKLPKTPAQLSKYVQCVRSVKSTSTQVELNRIGNRSSQATQTMFVSLDRHKLSTGLIPNGSKGPIIFEEKVKIEPKSEPLEHIHSRDSHFVYTRINNKFVCPYCSSRLATIKTLKRHMKRNCGKRMTKGLFVDLVRIDLDSQFKDLNICIPKL